MADVKLTGVQKFFGTVRVLKDVDLTIEDGEFCVFLGPSGCGKSTLLRMIAGLEEITQGDLYIAGQRMNDKPSSKRRISMVFQSYALYPHKTVFENMAFALKLAKEPADLIQREVRRAAEILHLSELMERYPRALSGGQRQRVAIGRAIVRKPDVFLFDEPLSNLDAALRSKTRVEIAKLHKSIGNASMVYVTHDQVEAMTLADKIVLLNTGPDIERSGSIAQVGSPLELYDKPRTKFVAQFIGSPQMNLFDVSLEPGDGSGSLFRTRNGKAISVAVDTTVISGKQQLAIGFRPEHTELRKLTEASERTFSVSHIEALGEASLIYLDTGDDEHSIVVRESGLTKFKVNDLVEVLPRPSLVHFFDSQGFRIN